MLSKGQRINDRYEIVKSIGEGGMANVYLANDLILDRKVAIKVLRGDLSNDDKFIRRFQREALSVSNLSHPNIVEVYDVGEEDGQHYIVMEYIDGMTLKQLLKKRGSLTVPEVVDIMTQLTDGLAHAHAAYIIHRDIKPQNIMIMDNGLIKITDFGIAMALNATQLTQTNSVMGSVHYLPPEQASGKGATIKSDIYSLGILMYELLTGTIPFKGDNAVEIALKHLKEPMPSLRKQNPTIPQSVENIVMKAAAKNPRNRYDSVMEMHEDLVKCLDNPDVEKYSFEYPEIENNDEAKKLNPIKKIKKPIVNKEEIPSEEISTEIKSDFLDEDTIPPTEKKKNKVVIILSCIFLSLIIIGVIIFTVLMTGDVKEISVPNLTNKEINEALDELTKLGFDYVIETESSDKVEEGHVISTLPKAGTVRKKGTIITVVKSSGGDFHYLEDYTGLDYKEVKAKLELLGINVLIERKDVENKDDYKDKTDHILEQNPKYNSEEKKLLEKGDTITLYIPNIVEEYPNMVEEGWTLSEVIAFVKEYNVLITVLDKNNKVVPQDKYEELKNSKITYQSRIGDPIISGISIKVKIADALPEEKPASSSSSSSGSGTE